jgi:hypothetical protein
MLKRFLPVLLAPLIVTGCTATFTNLSPLHQPRTTNNLYTVEVALNSRQQSLRWETIRPQVLVGTNTFQMRSTQLMTNRWEGLILVPADANLIHYRYKFDFEYNTLGKPKPDSALSEEYTLHILESKPE